MFAIVANGKSSAKAKMVLKRWDLFSFVVLSVLLLLEENRDTAEVNVKSVLHRRVQS